MKIEYADNGFLIELEDEDNEGKKVKRFVVFEEEDELENMKKLLWYIKEHFGVFYSKHNKQNLEIEVKNNE
jgi:hypothetical protein